MLAPHIDDDAIGCGGTLAKHAGSGDEIAVLYFADCTPERRREATRAASIIGIKDGRLGFLEYASKGLFDHRKDAAERLKAEIDSFKPSIVYPPSLFDRHNDHLAVNHILADVLGGMRDGPAFSICAYEVWTPLAPNLIVDISETIDKKKAAVAEFKSQLASNDWLDAAVCLNRYRAITNGAGRYAEGFMMHSASDYLNLWKKVFLALR